MKFSLRDDGKRILVICIAACIMALNIKSFVRTGGLYPGGANGLTILLQEVFMKYLNISLPYTLINVMLNAFPVYIGFRYIGKKFTLYSVVMILLTGTLTDILPGFKITYDPLLISIFGGIVNGLAIRMCLSVNATTGGTDFISIYLSEKKGVDSWNIIFFINLVIISSAGLLFGWDKALYSIIFQFMSTQVLHIMYQKYQKKTLFIVTNKAEQVCQVISNVSNHGATILDGEGSYEHCERNLVYSVVSSEESKKVIKEIRKADPKAFINCVRTEELSGWFYQKPND